MLDIAAGAGPALAQVEKRMGRFLAAMKGGKPTYAERRNPDGSTTRAWALWTQAHLNAAVAVAGDLAPGLRLRIAPITSQEFAIVPATKCHHPIPQIDEGALAALRTIKGRK